MPHPVPDKTRAQILIIEDECIIAGDIQNTLEQLGYGVVAVISSGDQAVDTASEQQPDLVLMDIKLRGAVDGLTAAAQIRQRFDIPVVYLTSLAYEATLRQAEAIHAFSYILKPFTDRELQVVIEIALHQHKLEKQLKESDSRYRMLLEQASDGILIADRQGNCLEANPKACEMLGYSRTELLQLGLMDIVPPENLPTTLEYIAELHAGKTIIREGRLRRKDGTYLPVEISAKMLPDGRLQGIMRDITGRKQAEAQMRKLSNALEQAADTVIITDREGRIEYVNAAFERITGYAKAEAIGQTPRFLKSDQHSPQFYEKLWQTILAGELFQATFVNRRKNGQLYYEDRMITPLKDDRGQITHFVSTGRDVTAHRLARKMLRASQERLAEAQRIAHLGNYEWYLPTSNLFVSDEIYQIFGVAADQFDPNPETFLNSVHSDDRRLVEEALYEALYHRKPYSIDYRIVRPDGEIRSVHGQAKVSFDRAGQPLKIIGTIQDITERKRLEAQLEAVYNLGRELILLRDEETIIKRVLEMVIITLQFEGVTWGLVNEITGELIYRYCLTGEHFKKIDVRLPLTSAQGIGVAVVYNAQVMNAAEASRESGYVPDSQAARSKLCLPVKVGRRIIGVLDIESSKLDRFTLTDQRLLQTLADQTAAALENTRLYAERQRQAQELTILNKAAKAMASSLDLNIVLERVVMEAKSILGVEGAAALLYDPIREELVFAVAKGPYPDTLVGLRLPITVGIAGWTVRERQPALVNQAQQDPRFYRVIDAVTNLTTRSLLAVPLILNDQIIGVIEVINRIEGSFSQHDLELLEALSSSATIAIKNARLYEAERRRHLEAEALRRAALVLTSTTNLDQVFEHILAELQNVVPYDSASVQLLKEDHLEIIGGRGFADLAAVVGIAIPIRSDSSPNARVLASLQPLIIDDVVLDSSSFNYRMHQASLTRSWLGAPLLIGNRAIGMITLDKHEPDFYTLAHAHTALAYAAQAAVAIENARLYEAEREQFRRLQQSQAQLIQVEKMAALGRLVGSIAHEINNPIQAIQNCLSLFKEELNHEQRPEKLIFYSEIAMSELDRITTIIRRMRNFYRPSYHSLLTHASNATTIEQFYRLDPLELQILDVCKIIEEVLQLTSKQLQNSGITVERVWADHLPTIQGNPDLLKQVFLNLILNAIDAMTEQSGTLRICTWLDEMVLHNDQPQLGIYIAFSDVGKGMSPEILNQLFEPLVTTKEHGSGFGLFTSYQIIKAHHGQIDVKSEVGRGTTFTIVLPFAQP
jgi:PAS domain S-box-containing protein